MDTTIALLNIFINSVGIALFISCIIAIAKIIKALLNYLRAKTEKLRIENEQAKNEEFRKYQQQQPHKETYEEFKARREREQAEQQRNNGGYSTVTVFSGVAAASTLTGLLLPILAAGLL